MMYYENGRFQLGGISFALPDRVCIDPEFEAEIQHGFELVDPGQRFRVTIQAEYSEEDSEQFLSQTLTPDAFHKLGKVAQMELGGIPGHSLEYESGGYSYFELRLDLPSQEEWNCVVVLVKWDRGTLTHEQVKRERILTELLESIRKA